jgi:hypothetical protein
VFGSRTLLADVLASLNSGALAQRRFREIARVAGLVFTGYPGAPKSMRPAAGLELSVLRGVPQVRLAGNRLLAQADAPKIQCWRRTVALAALLLGAAAAGAAPARKGRSEPPPPVRKVGKVFDGSRDIGDRMVRDGHAWSTRFKYDRGPYIAEERMAKSLKRGLHAEGGAMLPREFRQRNGPCQ